MRCPECGAHCWRDAAGVGVGVITGPWFCAECSWDEDQAFPMTSTNWIEWLNEGPKPNEYLEKDSRE